MIPLARPTVPPVVNLIFIRRLFVLRADGRWKHVGNCGSAEWINYEEGTINLIV